MANWEPNEVKDLTAEEINEAIEQMVSFSRQKVEAHKAGVGEYEFLLARGVLYDLGYITKDTDQVLKVIHDRGFTHCLDPHFPWTDPDTKEVRYPSPDSCYWGADQLLSRLRALR